MCRRWIYLIWVAALQVSCSRFQVHAEAELDDGRTSVIVYSRAHGPDVVRVGLKSGESEVMLYYDSADRMIKLVEVALVDDTVGILVGSAWAPHIELAYSLSKRTTVPYSSAIRAAVQDRLVRRYALTETDLLKFESDPIQWACSDRSKAFARFEEAVGPSRRLRSLSRQNVN